MSAELRSLWSPELIRERVSKVAAEIDAVCGEEPLVAVCVLKGAVHFFADLTRAMRNPNLLLDFVRLSSYGSGTESSGHVVFGKDVDTDLRGRHVLIVEDIVDSGLSMRFLKDQFRARGPASVRLAALVDKRGRRAVDVKVDFAGFVLEDDPFIVGFGMDCDERWRALPGVFELIP